MINVADIFYKKNIITFQGTICTGNSVYDGSMSRTNTVSDSFKALMLSHFFIGLGFIIAGFSSYLFINQNMPPIWWMTLVGLGLYMVYIPFNSVFFDRLIAAFKHTGNVGFLIYLADSFGYVGSVGVMMSKEIFKVQLNWVTFFSNSVIWLSLAGLALTIFSSFYFYAKYRTLVLK